jgi:hypothetical protein
MIEKLIRRFIKEMYLNAHKKRLYWIYYTVLIGFLPIAIRFVVSLSVPFGQIPLFAIGDVVFWGIMLNAVVMYNVASSEDLPDVQTSATAWAFIRSAILIALFTADLFPISNYVVLWILVTPLIVFSFAASLLSTDSIFLHAEQKIYALANNIEGSPLDVRPQVKEVLNRWVDGKEPVDVVAEVNTILTQYKSEMEQYVENHRQQVHDQKSGEATDSGSDSGGNDGGL